MHKTYIHKEVSKRESPIAYQNASFDGTYRVVNRAVIRELVLRATSIRLLDQLPITGPTSTELLEYSLKQPGVT